MPSPRPITGEGRAALLADLAAGRRRAVGWGMGGLLPYALAALPFPLAGLVDRRQTGKTPGPLGIPLLPPSVLAGFDPVDTVVVVFADMARFGDEIAAMVAVCGPFPVIAAPEPADRVCGAGGRDGEDRRVLARLRRVFTRQTVARRPFRSGSGVIDLVINSLGPGGAERQLCLLAADLRRLGWRVRVVPLTGAPPHPPYDAILAGAGVLRRDLPPPRAFWGDGVGDDWERAWAATGSAMALAPFLRPAGTHALAMLTRLWRDDPPDLAIAYLDDANILAAFAAGMTGVSRVLMCGRSIRSDHFPEMTHLSAAVGDLPLLYRTVLRRPGVRLANNSDSGARSYEAWLGLPAGRIRTVRNGIAMTPLPAGTDAGAARRGPLLLGVLRLTEEKCPLLFVEVVAGVARAVPGLRVLLAGDGPLRPAVEARIAALGLGETLTLAGVCADIPALISAADLLLNVSRIEGQPNVVLEAQALARPVVATRAGGTSDCLAPALRSWSCAVGDGEGLVRACVTLLRDPPRAAALGAAARRFVEARFSLPGLAERTLAAAGLGPPDGGPDGGLDGGWMHGDLLP